MRLLGLTNRFFRFVAAATVLSIVCFIDTGIRNVDATGLSSLTTNPDGLFSFNPTTFDYSATIPYETKLSFRAVPQDPLTFISLEIDSNPPIPLITGQSSGDHDVTSIPVGSSSVAITVEPNTDFIIQWGSFVMQAMPNGAIRMIEYKISDGVAPLDYQNFSWIDNHIKLFGTDKCLEVMASANGNIDNGNPIGLFPCDASKKNQKFTKVVVGSEVLIQSAVGKCIHVPNGLTNKGINAQLNDCNGQTSKFTLVPLRALPTKPPTIPLSLPASYTDADYYIQWAHPGRNGYVITANSFSLLATSEYLENGNSFLDATQKFTWSQENNQIKLLGTDLCFDVLGGFMRSGDYVALWQCHGGANQQFKRRLIAGGKVLIEISSGGKCLEIRSSIALFGMNIIFSDCDENNSQQHFKLNRIPDDFFTIQSARPTTGKKLIFDSQFAESDLTSLTEYTEGMAVQTKSRYRWINHDQVNGVGQIQLLGTNLCIDMREEDFVYIGMLDCTDYVATQKWKIITTKNNQKMIEYVSDTLPARTRKCLEVGTGRWDSGDTYIKIISSDCVDDNNNQLFTIRKGFMSNGILPAEVGTNTNNNNNNNNNNNPIVKTSYRITVHRGTPLENVRLIGDNNQEFPLSPLFDSSIFSYTVSVPPTQNTIKLDTTLLPGSRFTWCHNPAVGERSCGMDTRTRITTTFRLSMLVNTITLAVMAPDFRNMPEEFTFQITRLPWPQQSEIEGNNNNINNPARSSPLASYLLIGGGGVALLLLLIGAVYYYRRCDRQSSEAALSSSKDININITVSESVDHIDNNNNSDNDNNNNTDIELQEIPLPPTEEKTIPIVSVDDGDNDNNIDNNKEEASMI